MTLTGGGLRARRDRSTSRCTPPRSRSAPLTADAAGAVVRRRHDPGRRRARGPHDRDGRADLRHDGRRCRSRCCRPRSSTDPNHAARHRVALGAAGGRRGGAPRRWRSRARSRSRRRRARGARSADGPPGPARAAFALAGALLALGPSSAAVQAAPSAPPTAVGGACTRLDRHHRRRRLHQRSGRRRRCGARRSRCAPGSRRSRGPASPTRAPTAFPGPPLPHRRRTGDGPVPGCAAARTPTGPTGTRREAATGPTARRAPGSRVPPPGSVEGWAFGDEAEPGSIRRPPPTTTTTTTRPPRPRSTTGAAGAASATVTGAAADERRCAGRRPARRRARPPPSEHHDDDDDRRAARP